MRSLAVSVSLLWVCAAHAQALVETVETGDVGSAWTLRNPTSGITFGPSTLAAHRGSYGVRLDDHEATLTNTFGPIYDADFISTSSAAYSRMWVRQLSGNNLGGTNLYSTTWGLGGFWRAAHFFTTGGPGAITVGDQGVDGTGAEHYRNSPTGFSLEDAGWHLLEASSLGRGTDAGVVTFAIDAKVVIRHDGVLAITDAFKKFGFGEDYVYGTGYQAVIDFDDIRVDVMPLASRFSLLPVGEVVANRCFAMRVELDATFTLPDGGDPGALPAPYPVAVAIDGAGTLYEDAACTMPITGPQLATGSLGQTFHAVAPDGGTLALTVRQSDGPNDFISFSLPVVVAAFDGGTGPGDGGTGGGGGAAKEKSYYAAGCSVVPPGAGLLLLAILLWRRRSSVRWPFAQL